MAGRWHVGVRQLVDERHLGTSRYHCIEIHLFEHDPAIFDATPGYDLQAPGGPRVVERCVGAGSHTGYWSEAALGDWIMRLVLSG